MNRIVVEFEFAIKKNIVVGINSVNPEMWKASVLGGKGRSVETTWHLQVVGLESFATTAPAGSWLGGVCEGGRIEKRGDGGPGRMDEGCFLETLTQTHSGMKMLSLYISLYTPFPSPRPVDELCFIHHQVYYVSGIVLGTWGF